jgi:hypothetical protein
MESLDQGEFDPGYCAYCARGLGGERTGACDECDVRVSLEAHYGTADLERVLLDAAPASLGAADAPYDWAKWGEEDWAFDDPECDSRP